MIGWPTENFLLLCSRFILFFLWLQGAHLILIKLAMNHFFLVWNSFWNHLKTIMVNILHKGIKVIGNLLMTELVHEDLWRIYVQIIRWIAVFAECLRFLIALSFCEGPYQFWMLCLILKVIEFFLFFGSIFTTIFPMGTHFFCYRGVGGFFGSIFGGLGGLRYHLIPFHLLFFHQVVLEAYAPKTHTFVELIDELYKDFGVEVEFDSWRDCLLHEEMDTLIMLVWPYPKLTTSIIYMRGEGTSDW